MKIRFEKVEFEVSPQFVEHVAKVFTELELLRLRVNHERTQAEAQSRQGLIVAIATALIQPLREIIEAVREHNKGNDGDGDDDASGTEGGGDGEGSSQPA